MRTQDPATIRPDFEAALDGIDAAFTASETSVPGDPNKKLIAEYLFVAMASLLEGFISDLIIAYINRDATRFKEFFINNLEIKAKDVKDDQAQRAKDLVEMSMPHLSVDKIRKLLDPSGANIAFPLTASMKETSAKWLVNDDRDRFTGLSQQHAAILDAIKKIRNYLAHRSANAETAMQEMLFAANLPAELKRGQNNVNDVGAYLRALQGSARFHHYVTHVRAIALQLCP